MLRLATFLEEQIRSRLQTHFNQVGLDFCCESAELDELKHELGLVCSRFAFRANILDSRVLE